MLGTCTDCVPNFQGLEYLPIRWARNAKVPNERSPGRGTAWNYPTHWVQVRHMLKDKKWTVQLRWKRKIWWNRRDLVYTRYKESFHIVLWDLPRLWKQFGLFCSVLCYNFEITGMFYSSLLLSEGIHIHRASSPVVAFICSERNCPSSFIAPWIQCLMYALDPS